MKRVVVTGMGVVTPVGNTVETFWKRLKAGEHGFGPITKFNTDDFSIKLAGEVKNFYPEEHVRMKDLKRMDEFSVYAIAAAQEAILDSALELENMDKTKFGVFIASGTGGLSTIERQVLKMHEKESSKTDPLFIPMAIINMASAWVSMRYGLKGNSFATVSACAAATHAIGEAFRTIKHGYATHMLAGGSEASVCPVGMGGFTALKTLSDANDVHRLSIPFDLERRGFAMGEGAGMIVLEEYEAAKTRGAHIYGEIIGYGASCDAFHITSPQPDGLGSAQAMELALKEAKIQKSDIDYINAHGTGTKANDSSETKAIKQVFQSHARNLSISSTKSVTGHLLGAAGAIEAIACLKALEESFIPPTANLRVPDPDCDLNYTPNQGISKHINYALSNSMGFGGHNAALIFKKWEGLRG